MISRLFRSSRFTHVVPIGMSCRVSYHVRENFRGTPAYPFDWWGTPIDGLTRYLLNPDPDRIYGPGALAESPVDGHVATIVAPEFDFLLYHDFPRHDVGLPTRVVVPDWRAHIPAARAQHVRRLNRMLALDRPGTRILFVRDRLDIDRSVEEPDEAVARLWEVLSERWSRAKIELLLVNVPRDTHAPRRGVSWTDFPDAPGEGEHGWHGNSEGWASALQRNR